MPASLGPSQLSVTAAYDNTQVSITPSYRLNGSGNGHAASVPFVINLNKGETYFVTSNEDVSGSHLLANLPISVMAGGECVNIPSGVPYCNPIYEMMPPISTWGKSFLALPLATRTRGEVFRILASEDNTYIKINGVMKTMKTHLNLTRI